MINLDRLRDSPLLMAGFEDLVRFWNREPVEPMADDAPEYESLALDIDWPLPEIYRHYWEIAERYPALPLKGNGDGILKGKQLVGAPFRFAIGDDQRFERIPVEEERPGSCMKITRSANCQCCFVGIRPAQSAQSEDEWELVEIDDSRFRKVLPISVLDYMMEFALQNLASFWVYARRDTAASLEKLQAESETIWTAPDSQYWFHGSGILGNTHGTFHSFTTRTRAQAEKCLGRPLDPLLG